MGYGSRALSLLEAYYTQSEQSLDEDNGKQLLGLRDQLDEESGLLDEDIRNFF